MNRDQYIKQWHLFHFKIIFLIYRNVFLFFPVHNLVLYSQRMQSLLPRRKINCRTKRDHRYQALLAFWLFAIVVHVVCPEHVVAYDFLIPMTPHMFRRVALHQVRRYRWFVTATTFWMSLKSENRPRINKNPNSSSHSTPQLFAMHILTDAFLLLVWPPPLTLLASSLC